MPVPPVSQTLVKPEDGRLSNELSVTPVNTSSAGGNSTSAFNFGNFGFPSNSTPSGQNTNMNFQAFNAPPLPPQSIQKTQSSGGGKYGNPVIPIIPINPPAPQTSSLLQNGRSPQGSPRSGSPKTGPQLNVASPHQQFVNTQPQSVPQISLQNSQPVAPNYGQAQAYQINSQPNVQAFQQPQTMGQAQQFFPSQTASTSSFPNSFTSVPILSTFHE